MTIVWILVPLFAAAGLYLIWYSRRTHRLLVDFAATRGLSYHGSDDGQLEAALDAALRLEGPGRVRSFGQIRDLAHAQDGIVLFRGVELLDLRRHGSSETTHHSRVAVTFPVSERPDVFVLAHPDLRLQSVTGSPSGVEAEIGKTIREALEGRPPRCPLSLTLRRGRGVIYLEPLVTGSVREQDLEYLIATAAGLRAAFA